MNVFTSRNGLTLLALFLSIFISSASQQVVNYGVADGLSDGCVKAIAQDGHGYIWIATDYGLNRYEGDGFRRFEKNNSGLLANELNYISPDSRNKDIIWIATQRKGFADMIILPER